jgi:PAS domain S-box-containing protein
MQTTMTDRFEVTVETGRQADVTLDASSARDLELFLTRFEPPANAPVTRPVIVWKNDTRRVMDVRAYVADDGAWRLEFDNERPADDAPDAPERVDPRLDDLATMVWITDADRLARWFNRAWCTFVGAELEEELGWGWMRHAHPDDLVGLLEAYERGQRAQRGFDHVGRVIDRDGLVRWLRVRGVPRIQNDEFGGFIGICRLDEHAATDSEHSAAATSPVPFIPPTDEPASAVVERLADLEVALRISRPAEPVEASCLRRLASRWAAQHEVLAPRHDDIVLAVGEATANSALHAYRDGAGEIRLECAIDAAHATFRVRDWGAWLPPSAERDSRGILLMERLADSFELRHLADGTEVILRFDIGTPVRA